MEHRVWHALRHAIAVRAALPSLDASMETEIVDPVNPGVLVFLRRFPSQTMVGVYNITPDSPDPAAVGDPGGQLGLGRADRETPLTDGPLRLERYQARWFVQQA